jgi:uncharacterized protein (TIGR02266 family)
MSDERRTTHRAHVPGVHATYETASGDLQQAEVMDLAVGGLFLRTDAPTAVGKRVALDIVVTGEPEPWSALGRVVWIRTTTVDDERPAGMAIKLIDVDDDVRAGIERLVALRERTEPGVGGPPSPQAPLKEPTMLGVGASVPSDLMPTPIAFAPVDVPVSVAVEPSPDAPAVAPEAAAAPIAREPSIAIDLVARKSVPAEAVLAAGAEGQNVEVRVAQGEAPAKRGRGMGWLLLVAVLVAAMAAYAFREQLLSVWHGVSS